MIDWSVHYQKQQTFMTNHMNLVAIDCAVWVKDSNEVLTSNTRAKSIRVSVFRWDWLWDFVFCGRSVVALNYVYMHDNYVYMQDNYVYMYIWLCIHARYLWIYAELIPGLRPANERRRYFVTTSLIGLAQT